jgi:ABC-type antimicrobial peptide transport system permease subunit
MFKNYLKIAFRQLLKNRSYVLINTFGMGIALACCLAAYILVAFNIEFDDFHDDTDTSNMVKVIMHLEHQNGNPYADMVTPTVMGPIAAEEISGIKRFSRFVQWGGSVSTDEHAFSESISFADKAFLQMFPFPMKYGSSESFQEEQSILLGEDLAYKLFGDEDPTGKQLLLKVRDKSYDVLIGGVFEHIPLNSSFQLNALVRMETFVDVFDIDVNEWGEWRDASLVLELSAQEAITEVTAQLNKYVPVRNKLKPDSKLTEFELRPFAEPVDEDEVNWSHMNVLIPFLPIMIFVTLASIILLIACFNLTNTTIALTGKRLKEIGVRKVVGARRFQIVVQYLLEMTMTIVLAIIAGLGMAQLIVPEFTAMWGIAFGFDEMSYLNLFAALIIILFASALLAGLYPALNNSKFNPVKLLKGGSTVKGTNVLTRTLLVIQFSLSVIVLVAGIIFTMNSNFQQSLSMGYDTDGLLVVNVQGKEQFTAMRNTFLTNPAFVKIAITDHHIGYGSYPNPITVDTTKTSTQVYEIGANYFDVMGLSISKGRSFKEHSELDQEKSAIVDEAFVEFHQLENPLASRIWFQEVWYDVVGVVQNHRGHLWRNEQAAVGHFYRMAKPEQYRNMVIKVSNSIDILSADSIVSGEWKGLYPSQPFNSRTQEDVVFANVNQTNRNLTIIFLFLTVLGCLLSASGIYALANLNIGKRVKEIGVRKVLGASVSSIVQLVNREFFIILLLAMILGGAGGFILTEALLTEIYETHIEVKVFTVFLCGLLVFFIGMGTTSSTILRAAKGNPVDTLRDE